MPYAQPKTCLLALAITLSIACHPQGARAEVMPGEQSATRFFDLPAAPPLRPRDANPSQEPAHPCAGIQKGRCR